MPARNQIYSFRCPQAFSPPYILHQKTHKILMQALVSQYPLHFAHSLRLHHWNSRIAVLILNTRPHRLALFSIYAPSTTHAPKIDLNRIHTFWDQLHTICGARVSNEERPALACRLAWDREERILKEMKRWKFQPRNVCKASMRLTRRASFVPNFLG